MVRRPHAVGLREEGQAEPRGAHVVHEHGGAHPRGRHPDGGRRRVQGRQEGRRPEEDVPRVPPRALRARRRQLVRHPEHAWRHRLRRPGRQALPPAPRDVETFLSVSTETPDEVAQRAKPRSSTRWARPCASRRGRSPTSPAR